MNRPPRWTGVGGPSSRLGRRARRRRAGLQPAGEPVAGGRGRWSRLSPTWRRVIKISLAAIALLSGILGGMVAYAALTLPDVGDIGKLTGTIKIVDRNGKPLAEVGRDRVSRSPVSLANVSQPMQEATIAAEDRNFYEEGAFNAGRVLKALFVDVILRQPAQGASTITQQLAKQAFFGASAEKSPLRKLREALLANEINARLSKSEILEKYLNITYYGENAYGVQNAAKRYFNKDAKSLDLREATMLAGLPQAPSFYDPYKNPQGSYLRQHYVLSGLVETGKVSQAEADAVDPFVGGESATPEQQSAQQRNQQDLAADLSRGRPLLTGVAPHFVQYVQDQLDQPPYNLDSEQINGDLTVTTTLDLDTQNKANTSVHDGIAGRDPIGRNANNGALLMIDAKRGDIEAMVGSADYNNNDIAGQYNIVTAERRPGSSFKPYVYAECFKTGMLRPDSGLDDTRAESQRLNGVTDFDNRYFGRISATTALVESRNIATEQAMVKCGVDNVIDFAHSLGITSQLAANASTAIGTSAVKMIDHAGAYAAFANGGHRIVPRAILKITTASGDVLFSEDQPAGHGDVMTPAQAYTVTGILRNYQRRWGLRFKYDTAGKSGTTDNFVDAWYMDYTPDWVVATWAGHTEANHPGELGMNDVFGVDEAQHIAVPFVNQLSKPAAFVPVKGALFNCSFSGNASLNSDICPTRAPSTFRPTFTPAPTETFMTPAPEPTPRVITPPPATLQPFNLFPTPTACPTPSGPGPRPICP